MDTSTPNNSQTGTKIWINNKKNPTATTTTVIFLKLPIIDKN
jgi:hypothetical protein